MSEGYITIQNNIADIECDWTFAGEVQAHGVEVKAKVALTNLVVTNCTNGWTPNVQSIGWLEISPVHGGPDGTVEWSGATVEFTHHYWGTCKYATYYTDGRLTGSATTGSTATLDFSEGLIFDGGHFACGGKLGQEVPWAGSFSITTPDSLNVD